MTRYLGIDMASDSFDVAIDSRVATLPNTPNGFAALCAMMQKGDIAVMEATGGYERKCVVALREGGFGVAIVNPADVRAFRKGMGVQAKTDAIDARMLARFAKARELTPDHQPDNPKLSELAKRRAQLASVRAAEKNRLGLAGENARPSIQRHIEWIDGEIKQLEEEIAGLIKGNEKLTCKAKLLMSAPGVGKVTAYALLAHLPELGSLTPKKVASLAGLAPHARESGKWKGRRTIGRGRTAVRKAMFMAVLGGKSGTNVLRDMVRRMVGAGKAPKQAIIATARKLLVALNAMLRDGTTFRESMLTNGAGA